MNDVRTRKSLIPDEKPAPASPAKAKGGPSSQMRVWIMGAIIVVMLGIVAYRTFFMSDTPPIEPQPAVEPTPQPPSPDQPQPSSPSSPGQNVHRTIISG